MVLLLSVPLLTLDSKSISLSAGCRLWVQVVRYDSFSVVFFLFGFSLLILSLSLLGLGTKSTSISPGLCVRRPRQYKTICLEFGIFFFRIFCLFLVDCWGGWSQWMWLVSCRRPGMLIQRPTRDPKCKLNISSFLALLHPLDYFICAKEITIIVLLLQMMGRWKGFGWFLHVRVWVGGQGVVIIFLYFLFWFCAVVNCSIMTGAW